MKSFSWLENIKERISNPPFTVLLLKRKAGEPLILSVKDRENGVVHLGIQTQILLGAEESDYDLDTPCQLLQLNDYGADGVVDGCTLECIAWTPKLEPYIKEHSQRLYDEFLLEAKALLSPQ